MSKVNKVHSINNSYYAQQSRARHRHQEKKINKIIFKKNQPQKFANIKANIDSFLSATLTGIKKESIKLLKKIFK